MPMLKIGKKKQKLEVINFLKIRDQQNIRKYIFSCLFSIHKTISLTCHEQVCLSGPHFERYFSYHQAYDHQAQWWEKYLSKRIPHKHTCSWHDRLAKIWRRNKWNLIEIRIETIGCKTFWKNIRKVLPDSNLKDFKFQAE